jgi:hypothetical protein
LFDIIKDGKSPYIWDNNVSYMKAMYSKYILLANNAVICASAYNTLEMSENGGWDKLSKE